MPDVENLDAVGLLVDVVEDAVGAKDDFAQSSFHSARIGGTNKGERGQNANMIEGTLPKPNGGLRVILGGIGANLLEVRYRRV